MNKLSTSDQLLLESAANGNVIEFKKALNLGANVNCKNKNGDTALAITSKCRLDLVKILIENNADPNLKTDSNITALHWAVEYDNCDIVEFLLSNGAKPNLKDNLAETPIHWAGWTGHHKSAEILIKFGGDIDAKNCGGFTALDLAERQEHRIFLEKLKK